MSIKEFLTAKKDESFKMDEDKYQDYPIQFVNQDGIFETGFIQDAEINQDDNQYQLIVTVLKSDFTAFRFEKICTAPRGCVIDWDTLHCTDVIRV